MTRNEFSELYAALRSEHAGNPMMLQGFVVFADAMALAFGDDVVSEEATIEQSAPAAKAATKKHKAVKEEA